LLAFFQGGRAIATLLSYCLSPSGFCSVSEISKRS
jgi:hypothetical protein